MSKHFIFCQTNWSFFQAMQNEAMRQVWMNNSNEHEECFDQNQQCYLMGGEL
jgi:hypothetical protein